MHRRTVRPRFPVPEATRLVLEGSAATVTPPGLYWALADWFRERCVVRDRATGALLRPYKTIRIDPGSAERMTGRSYPPWENRFESFGTVEGGDWDRRPLDADPERHPGVRIYGGERVRRTTLYRSLRARFEDGVEWSETDLVATMREVIDAGRSAWQDCTSVADVRRRCADLDALYETLRREGFRSQLDLVRRDGVPPSERPFADVMRNEVAVDIGRDGEPLLVEGKHRLILADLLDLDAVTAVVYVRHPEWLETRTAVGDGRESAGDHPDLRTLPR